MQAAACAIPLALSLLDSIFQFSSIGKNWISHQWKIRTKRARENESDPRRTLFSWALSYQIVSNLDARLSAQHTIGDHLEMADHDDEDAIGAGSPIGWIDFLNPDRDRGATKRERPLLMQCAPLVVPWPQTRSPGAKSKRPTHNSNKSKCSGPSINAKLSLLSARNDGPTRRAGNNLWPHRCRVARQTDVHWGSPCLQPARRAARLAPPSRTR